MRFFVPQNDNKLKIIMKKINKNFAITSSGMEPGSLKFNFRPSYGKSGRSIESINEIRYSVTDGKDRVWILLPPSVLLSFIADGFESGVLCFQHRVSTKDGGRTEWGESGEIEIIVNREQLTSNNMGIVMSEQLTDNI